jgi:hypothetical protein
MSSQWAGDLVRRDWLMLKAWGNGPGRYPLGAQLSQGQTKWNRMDPACDCNVLHPSFWTNSLPRVRAKHGAMGDEISSL